jgi:ApeA N-terminal domain 1
VEWHGFWWRPNEADHRLPGTLTQRPDTSLALRLTGGLDGDEPETGDGLPQWPLLHGATANGELLTLVDCWTERQRTGLDRTPHEQELHVGKALVGCHLPRSNQQVFGSLRFEIEDLYYFCRHVGPPVPNEDEIPEPPDPESDQFDRGKFQYKLERESPHHSGCRQKRGRVEMSTRSAAISVSASNPTAYDKLLQEAGAFQDLLTLSTQAPCAISDLKLTLYAKKRRGRQVDLLAPGIVHPSPTAPGTTAFLFGLGDHTFTEIGKSWLDVRDKCLVACNLLLGSIYRPAGYVENRVLISVASAEALHRVLSTIEGLPNEDHAKLIEAVSNLDPVVKRWALDRIGRNEPSLKERLCYLLLRIDPEAITRLLSDGERWATRAKTARNNIAHGLVLTTPQKINQALAIIETTNSVVKLALLTELGIQPPSLRAIVEGDRTIAYARSSAAKHL